MHIVDILSGSIPIIESKVNLLSFEDKDKIRQLIKYFVRLGNTKGSIDTDIYIVDDKLSQLTSKDINFIFFDDIILLSKYDKMIRELIIKYLKFKLETDSDLLLEYIKSKRYIEEFFNDIKIKNNNYYLEFFLEDIDLESIIKKLEIDIFFNKDEEDVLDIMKLIVDLSIKLEIKNKTFFICMLFPENSIKAQKFSELLNYFRELKITTLIITTDELLYSETLIDDNIILVNNFFEKYDIDALKSEYELFYDSIEWNKLLQLAFLDFKSNYNLIDPKLKKFLISKIHK